MDRKALLAAAATLAILSSVECVPSVYNTSHILLQTSGPVVLTIKKDGEIKDKINLPSTGFNVVSENKTEPGKDGDTLFINTMTITYATVNNSLTDVVLKIETTLDQRAGYWKISDMAVSYKGKYETTNEKIWVDKRPGALNSNSTLNWNCMRGFTSCAPRDLSWTCDGQVFTSRNLLPERKDTQETKAQGTVVTFPGMEIQHLPGSGKIRFGFNWDCDPVISSALWVTLLLGLALIFALYWSCDMIGGLTTPDRFDDPKKTQPIMVPTAE